MATFGRSHTGFYSSSIVTTAVFCIVFEIKRNIGRKSRFFHTFSTSQPPPPSENGGKYIRVVFLSKPSQIDGLPGGANRFWKDNPFMHSTRATQTNGRTGGIVISIADRVLHNAR